MVVQPVAGGMIRQDRPFQSTVAPETKPVPLTVSVNPGLKAATVPLEGINCEMTGTAFPTALTMNGRKLERLLPAVEVVVLPGAMTPTSAVAGLAMSARGKLSRELR